jgi:hypothetical protein
MTRQQAKAKVISVWWCSTCQMQVYIQGQPRRQRHVTCQRWMEFLRTYHPRPEWPYPNPTR